MKTQYTITLRLSEEKVDDDGNGTEGECLKRTILSDEEDYETAIQLFDRIEQATWDVITGM